MSSSRRPTRAWTEGSPSEPPYNTDGNGECKNCWAWHPFRYVNRFGAEAVGENAAQAGVRDIDYVVKVLWEVE
jgi:hypothetical protein